MIFEQIDAGGDRNFSYLIGDEESRLCAVVDPGYDTSKLEARVKDLGLKVAYILNTHTHHDHVAGNGRPLSWAPSADAVAGGGKRRHLSK